MVRIIFPFRARVDYRHVEPVNSVTVKGLQPLWNEGSPRTNNNCLAFSNHSYSGIDAPYPPSPKEKNAPLIILQQALSHVCMVDEINNFNKISSAGQHCSPTCLFYFNT